ncbi:hypothetical protein V6U81_25500, partial [Micromonospora sp. CPCC 205711]
TIGLGRLAEIGPVPWQAGAVGTAVVTVGAVLGAAAARVVARPATPPRPPRARIPADPPPARG